MVFGRECEKVFISENGIKNNNKKEWKAQGTHYHECCNCWRVRNECGRSQVRSPVEQTQQKTMGNCCFSDKNAALRRRTKDWLTLSHDNVSITVDLGMFWSIKLVSPSFLKYINQARNVICVLKVSILPAYTLFFRLDLQPILTVVYISFFFTFDFIWYFNLFRFKVIIGSY